MTNQQGAPEALRLAAEVLDWMPTSDTQRALWDRHQKALVVVKAALVEAQQPAPSAAAHKACKPDMLVNGGALKLALNVLRRAGKNEVADELEATAQPSPTPQADSQPAPERDYPPLPEPDLGMPWRVNAKSDGAAHSSGFTCEQMRAYVDADRAARAPADSVTAPAGGANWAQLRSALAMLMLGWGRNPNQTMDACYRVLDSATEPGTALAILRTAPDWRDFMAADRAKVDSVLEDAARYRWLREKPGADLRYGSEQYTRVCAVCQNYGEDLDAAIDAARKQGANHD